MSAGFLLDTNVLSELMRAQPAAAVLTVATRNTNDFGHIDGLSLADPWQAPMPH